MDLNDVIRWFHLLAAMVWVGGMITVAAIVPVLRKSGVSRDQLRAMARRYGTTSWVAMVLSVTTGMLQLVRLDIELSGALGIKIVLVGLAVTLAFIHQEIARNVGPAVRGAMEGGLLLLGLAILAAAVTI